MNEYEIIEGLGGFSYRVCRECRFEVTHCRCKARVVELHPDEHNRRFCVPQKQIHVFIHGTEIGTPCECGTMTSGVHIG